MRVPTASQNWDHVEHFGNIQHLGVNNLSHDQVPSRNNKISAWQKNLRKIPRIKKSIDFSGRIRIISWIIRWTSQLGLTKSPSFSAQIWPSVVLCRVTGHLSWRITNMGSILGMQKHIHIYISQMSLLSQWFSGKPRKGGLCFLVPLEGTHPDIPVSACTAGLTQAAPDVGCS